MEKRLNPMNDFLFKKMFGEQGCEEPLISLLNATFEHAGVRKVKDVYISDNLKLTQDTLKDKFGILDVLATSDNGSKINVEIQRAIYGSMDKRSAYYASKLYAKSIELGNDFSIIPPVVTINILDFDFIKLQDFHTTFHMCEDKHKDYVLEDILEMHFIEMTKFKLVEPDLNIPIHRWLVYLQQETSQKQVKELIELDSSIGLAESTMERVTMDAETLRIYELREKHVLDMTSGINYARREGHKEGREEERKASQRKLQIETDTRIRRLIEHKMPLEDISEIYDLTPKEVFEKGKKLGLDMSYAVPKRKSRETER